MTTSGMTTRFPANPQHGDIFELRAGLLFQYDAAVNAWIKIVSSNLMLPVATNIANGAMTAVDLKKLNRLVIPPPRSTIIGNDCIAPFKAGAIALYSGDNFVNVEGNIVLQNIDEFGDLISDDFPFQIHQHTYGYDFNLDIPRLVTELKRRGQFESTGTVGPKGDKGEEGDPGVDEILSGPQGDRGEQGDAPECELTIETEPVQSETQPGLQKALVAARVIPSVQFPNDATKYGLQFDRQTIGTSDVSTSRFMVQQQNSFWILAVESIVGTPQAIYYLDIEPLIEAVRQKFLTEVELLKSGYEDIVAFWIQTMSDLFDEQKDALCCAIECCKSRTKGTQLRQHMESVAASALPDAKINIHGRKSGEAFEMPNTTMLVDTKCYDPPLAADEVCGRSGLGGGGGGGDSDSDTLEIDDSDVNPVDCDGGMDVVFVLDDTGSMGLYIEAMKSAATDYSNHIKNLSGGDYRLGLITFKDSVTVRLSMSPANQAQFVAILDTITASGGGDKPESSVEALTDALNGAAGNWRPTKADIAIVITDAPPSAGNAAAQVAANLAKSLNIRVSSIHVPLRGVGFDSEAEPALRSYASTSGGVYVKSGSNRAEDAIVDGALKVCSGSSPPPVGGFIAKLAVDPLINAGSANNGASVEIPAGNYVATITGATASINGKHRSNVRLQYANQGQRKSASFLDKGEFHSLVDGRHAYEGLTLPFSHDGGTASFYFPIIPQKRSAGEVQIEIKKANTVSSIAKAAAVEAPQPRPTLRRPQRAEKIVPVSDGSAMCTLDVSRLRWYERSWKTGNCCGVVVNVNGQDYIVVKNSLIGDDSCGGGENETTPCIKQFIKSHGHPSFAWPTLDGVNFVPIPETEQIHFKYDQVLNDLVAQKLADEEYNSPKGNPAGVRHLTFQLMTILFPVA